MRRTTAPGVVQPADGSPERVALNARVYDAVVRYVDRLFYDPDFGEVPFREEARVRRAVAVVQPTSEAFHGELKQLLNLLGDGHTHTWTPLRRLRNAEQIAGAPAIGHGFLMTWSGGAWVVDTVAPGSAAPEAGVLPDWLVESIGGRPLFLARPAALGRVDTIVFTDDAGERQSRDLEGVTTPLRPKFVAHRLDGNIAYFRFNDFGQLQYESYVAELEAFAADAPAGLIVDLRTNRGGHTVIMGAMTSWLYADEQEVVIMNGRHHSMGPQPKPYLGPVVMLIGPASSGSAELFTGVAQENGRAVIVGQTSRGSVTGARPIELPDGGILYVGSIVTTTPGGKRLEGVGVMPDIIVPDDWQAVREGRDPTLDAGVAALEALIAERRSTTTPTPQA